MPGARIRSFELARRDGASSFIGDELCFMFRLIAGAPVEFAIAPRVSASCGVLAPVSLSSRLLRGSADVPRYCEWTVFWLQPAEVDNHRPDGFTQR